MERSTVGSRIKKENKERNKEKNKDSKVMRRNRETDTEKAKKKQKRGGLQERGASCSYSNRWYAGPITTPMHGC